MTGPGPGADDAVPGLAPGPEVDGPSFTLVVDGEEFEVRPGRTGGATYTWTSGPNVGYGFGLGGPPIVSGDEHREIIRGFLAQIDPATGFLEDD